jgi:hypothetical protein
MQAALAGIEVAAPSSMTTARALKNVFMTLTFSCYQSDVMPTQHPRFVFPKKRIYVR